MMAAVQSPCVGICNFKTVEALCKGCYRTTLEKYGWTLMDDSTKQKTITLTKLRAKRYPTLKDLPTPEVYEYY